MRKFPNPTRAYWRSTACRSICDAGEVHALVGENGAGKSTLIRILSGDVQPDAGRICVRGRDVSFNSPGDARRSGIVTIFQELMIVPDMTVAENIVLGDEPGAGPLRQLYSRRRAEHASSEILHSLDQGSAINPRRTASTLSTGQKQIVEIARALIQRAPVIILDEPTAALSDSESETLLRILRQMRDEGAAILFVSHRLEEVRSIADRVTVLRGGRRIATLAASEVTGTGQLIELMIGRPLSEMFPPRNAKIGEIVLSVRGASRRGAFENISFEVRAGEVLGHGWPGRRWPHRSDACHLRRRSARRRYDYQRRPNPRRCDAGRRHESWYRVFAGRPENAGARALTFRVREPDHDVAQAS